MKMNRTQLRFISRGDLFDISLEQAIMGSSNSRNGALVQVFHRLGIAEAYGSGLRKIFRLYEREELQPEVEANGFFYLTLPNCNTTRNPHLNLRRNEGPDLRGDYDAFRRLDDEGRCHLMSLTHSARYESRRRAGCARSSGATGASPRAMQPPFPRTRCDLTPGRWNWTQGGPVTQQNA